LLRDSGVTYRFTGHNAVTLKLAGTAISVEVSANTTDVIASPKFTETLTETPQTISVIPQQVLQDQGTTTLRDALRNVAGISLAAGEGGAQGDNLTIRGFTARNDIFLDGMRDFGSYYRDSFNYEDLDVLQGPTSVTFGRGSTGGVVNQETKVPLGRPSISGSLVFGSDATKRITADINEPIGQQTAFRFNLMGNDAGVAGRDIAANRRFGVAPSIAFGLGTPYADHSELHARAGRRHARLRNTVAVQWPRSRGPPQLLRLQARQFSSHRRGHRHRQGRARRQ
jgi:catecholate siderophore receptor